MLPSSFEGSIFLLILANVKFLILSDLPTRCVRFQHLTIVKFLISSIFSSWFTQHTEYAHEHADTMIGDENSIVVVYKKTATCLYRLLFGLEVPPGFGPGNEGFADLKKRSFILHIFKFTI